MSKASKRSREEKAPKKSNDRAEKKEKKKKAAETVERRKDGTLIFEDFPDFRPNLTPHQVFEKGGFGGGYWRPIKSGVTNERYKDQHLEFGDYFADIPTRLLTEPDYDVSRNYYGVKSGQGLDAWESSNWIKEQDPYGWMQWYCRFCILGRRSDDDARQVQRWLNFTGPKGRFKRNLVNKIKNANAAYDDKKISPVIRQGLLHWAHEVTPKDIK